MKRFLVFLTVIIAMVSFIGFTAGCGGKADTTETTEAPAEQGIQQPDTAAQTQEVDMELQTKAESFLTKYLEELAQSYLQLATTSWKAANSGKEEDFKAAGAADLTVRKMHSDKERFAQIEELLKQKNKLKPLTARSLEVAELGFKGNQLAGEILEKMVNMGTEIEQIFTNFRGKVDNKEFNDNELIEMIKAETNSAKRQKIWEALKLLGDAVGPKLVELTKVRNQAAQELGYQNYWDMQIRLQEHNPEEIMSIFTELENVTNEPFKQMKQVMDSELAARFKIKPEEMMPWHYDNPFFQDAPPSAKVDLDDFYKSKTKEDIVALCQKFYQDIGLPIEDILARSDLYERPGKNQHAFCAAIDRQGDVRVLVNVTPTVRWMETILHEMGHGVYDRYMDFSLPYNLREPAHTFTTEAIAMLFGALAKNPLWLKNYAGADAQKVDELEAAILEQRRREQLIFARWTLVMLHFEKAMYENPDQDLNTLWWDHVERFQMLKRPQGRNAADWASKPHFTIAPVYYHNYMLGELLAAQLRSTLIKMAGHQGPAHTLDYSQHPEFGVYLKEKFFAPGASLSWPEFIKQATGEPLSAKYFAQEL